MIQIQNKRAEQSKNGMRLPIGPDMREPVAVRCDVARPNDTELVPARRRMMPDAGQMMPDWRLAGGKL